MQASNGAADFTICLPQTWIFGYAENVPRHISRFHFFDFEKLSISKIVIDENIPICEMLTSRVASQIPIVEKTNM